MLYFSECVAEAQNIAGVVSECPAEAQNTAGVGSERLHAAMRSRPQLRVRTFGRALQRVRTFVCPHKNLQRVRTFGTLCPNIGRVRTLARAFHFRASHGNPKHCRRSLRVSRVGPKHCGRRLRTSRRGPNSTRAKQTAE